VLSPFKSASDPSNTILLNKNMEYIETSFENMLFYIGFQIMPFVHNIRKCTEGLFPGMVLASILPALNSNEAQMLWLGTAKPAPRITTSGFII
jgi:hypothetical protein